MKAVIAVPFFDTPENKRAVRITLRVLKYLRVYEEKGHIVVPVNNGSTDDRAVDFAWNNFKGFIGFNEPRSISGAANAAWVKYHDELIAGTMIAVKHDADLMVDQPPGTCGWLDELVELFHEQPRIYLAGPRFQRQDYDNDQWKVEDHGWWFRTQFIYGGVQARSPRGFRAIGYARQPYGRWSWGDHWDTFRVKYSGGWLAVLRDHEFVEMEEKGGALPNAERQVMRQKGRFAFERLQEELRQGERTIWEDPV